ncbi:hypothetical protein B0O99DRAFT_725020, partial [Bisporella sp. PMI_857]
KHSKRDKRQTQRFAHIQRVLDFARSLVSTHCTVMRAGHYPSWPVDDEISLSLMILGETLTRAHIMIQQSCQFEMRGWHDHEYRNQGWGNSKHALLLLEKKWCRKAVAMLQAIMRRNSTGLIYLASLDIGMPQEQHKDCTYERCQVESPENIVPKESKHELRHSKKCDRQKCCEMKVNSKAIADIIKRGGIPLLLFHSSEHNPQIKLVPWERGKDPPEYHVFSHVWTDHFGDQDQNMINLCQLMEFKEIFARIRRRNQTKSVAGEIPTDAELFWIDTLTIPNGENYRNQRTMAVQTMHHVYLSAKNMIVLDNSLMDQEKGHKYSEAAIKITMSPWMRRLWTLQEAVYSKSIWFVFRHGTPCHMEELEDSFHKENKSLSSGLAEVTRAYHDMMLGHLRSNLLQKREKYMVDRAFVAATWKAAQWRTTSEDHHEALALAILFQLDVESFVSWIPGGSGTKEEVNARMRKLLELLSKENPLVPSGMIFLPGEPLTEEGYRWAPRTWLSAHDIDSPDPLLLTIDQPASLRKGAGLEVNFPGFILHSIARDASENEVGEISLDQYTLIEFPCHYTLSEWYEIEPADKEKFPQKIGDETKRLAIINPRLPLVSSKEIALLVSIKNVSNGGFEVQVLCRVWASRIQNLNRIEGLKRQYEDGEPKLHFIGEQLFTKKWIVDRSLELLPNTVEPTSRTQSEGSHSFQAPTRAQTFHEPKPAWYSRKGTRPVTRLQKLCYSLRLWNF